MRILLCLAIFSTVLTLACAGTPYDMTPFWGPPPVQREILPVPELTSAPQTNNARPGPVTNVAPGPVPASEGGMMGAAVPGSSGGLVTVSSGVSQETVPRPTVVAGAAATERRHTRPEPRANAATSTSSADQATIVRERELVEQARAIRELRQRIGR